MGASGGRLVREQVAEGALLALAGGAVGVLLARAALAALRVTEASGLPRVGDAGVDGRALFFALAATAGSVLLFALLPALRTSAVAPRAELHEGVRQGGPGRGAHRVSRALVTGEIALSVVLVTMAALVLASFAALRSVDPGLDADDVLVARLAPSPQRYAGDRAVGLYRALEERIAALPGVTAVGSIQLEPFSQGNWRFPYLAEGHASPAGAPLPMANFRAVTPGYFAAVDVPLLAGRLLQPEDGPGAQRVLLVNRAMASELWPGEDAVGREVLVFGSNPYRVVGVVGDVRQHALDRAPAPEMYVAHAQWVIGSMAMLVESPRATALAPAIREVVRTLDPDVPIADLRPLTGFLDDSLARRRFFVSLLAAFAALALVLGGVGVYGVTAHLVASLLPEAGLRLALGASPAAVLRRTMWRGFAPAALGLALGLPGALAAARLLRGLLFEVSPAHAPTWIGVAAVLGGVALLASWLPARRAARLDPLTVLRAD
jgi:predicted permease